MTSPTSKLTRIYEPFSYTFMRMMCGMGVLMIIMMFFAVYDMVSNRAWSALLMVPFILGIVIAMLRMYGPLRRVYASDELVQIRTGKEPLEIPFSELQSVERPRWAPFSNMGVSVVELKFSRETPRILMTIRDTDLEIFKAAWKKVNIA